MATYRHGLTTTASTCALAGANTIVAAPAAGHRLVIHMLQIQLEAAGAQTVIAKSNATAFWRLVGTGIGDGLLIEPPAGKEIPLGTAEALVLTLTNALSVGYVVRYSTEVVP